MITIQGVDPNMIANNIEPFYLTHPGEVLKEEIEYRGISQKELAADMDVPYTLLNEVLNAKRQVNTEFALLVEAVLGLDAEPLLKMQARYNMFLAKRNSKFVEKLNRVRKIAAVFCLLSLWSLTTFAQSHDYLWVNKKDGTAQSFRLDGLRKLTFTANDIVVQPVAGQASLFSFDAVQKLTFEDKATSIVQVPFELAPGIFYSPQFRSIVIENATQNGTVSVYNLQGRLLKNLVLKSEREEIPVSDFPAGVYIVKTGESVKKLIINN